MCLAFKIPRFPLLPSLLSFDIYFIEGSPLKKRQRSRGSKEEEEVGSTREERMASFPPREREEKLKEGGEQKFLRAIKKIINQFNV